MSAQDWFVTECTDDGYDAWVVAPAVLIAALDWEGVRSEYHPLLSIAGRGVLRSFGYESSRRERLLGPEALTADVQNPDSKNSDSTSEHDDYPVSLIAARSASAPSLPGPAQ